MKRFLGLLLAGSMICSLSACGSSDSSSETSASTAETASEEAAEAATEAPITLAEGVGNIFTLDPGASKDEVIELMGKPTYIGNGGLFYLFDNFTGAQAVPTFGTFDWSDYIASTTGVKGKVFPESNYCVRLEFDGSKLSKMHLFAKFKNRSYIVDVAKKTLYPRFKNIYPTLEDANNEYSPFVVWFNEMDGNGSVNSNGFSITVGAVIYKDAANQTVSYDADANFDKDIYHLGVIGRGGSSSGNYDKSDSYFSSNDHDNDGNLSEDEWLDAWKDYLNDKFDETGY